MQLVIILFSGILFGFVSGQSESFDLTPDDVCNLHTTPNLYHSMGPMPFDGASRFSNPATSFPTKHNIKFIRGPRKGPIFTMNREFNAFSGPVQNSGINRVDADVPKSRSDDSNSSPWKLAFPKNIWKLTLNKLEKGRRLDSITIDQKSPDFNSKWTLEDADDMTNFVDLSTVFISDKSWYLVCFNYSAVISDINVIDCSKCAVIRPCALNTHHSMDQGPFDFPPPPPYEFDASRCHQKLVTARVITGQSTNEKALVQFSTNRLPFENAIVRSHIYHSPRYPRCQQAVTSITPASTSTAKLMPNTLTYMYLGGLEKSKDYRVDSDVIADIPGVGEVTIDDAIGQINLPKCDITEGFNN